MARFPHVGDQFGRYHIDGQIGQGGMGVVFAATDQSFSRTVALKVVSAHLGDSEEFQARFEREASLLARLNSPHIIDIFDYGMEDGCPYISTQYVGGGDLGGLIQARGAMPPQLAASVCAQMADALSDAHRAGVVHRDVKPSNVLLRDANTMDLHAYLCDFGIARTDSDGLTQPGSVTGTWAYLSPECGKGETGTPKSDIYAIGCLLWVCLTGQAPYRGSDVEVAIAHQKSPIPQLSGTDEFTARANSILQRCMAKEPSDRYATADELRSELLAASTVHASGIQPIFQPPPPLAAMSGPSMTSGIRIGGSFGSHPPGPSIAGGTPAGSRKAPSSGNRTPLLVGGIAAAIALIVGGGFVIKAIAGGGDDEEKKPGPVASGPVTSDVNNDGYGDVIFSMPLKGELKGGIPTIRRYTWLSDGTKFTNQDPEAFQGDTIDTKFLGDYDGDDKFEVLRGQGDSESYTVTGELSGGESIDFTSDLNQAGPTTIYSVDFDQDGDDDLVVVDQLDRSIEISWRISDGKGGMAEPSPIMSVPMNTEGLNPQTIIKDITGDGYPDLGLLTFSDELNENTEFESTVALLPGNGEVFEQTDITATFESATDPLITSADVQGDGDAEVLVSSELDNNVRSLYMYDFDDDELVRSTTPVALFNPIDVGATQPRLGISDVDGDGRDDLVSVAPTGSLKKDSTITVSLSDGERWGTPQEWGRWEDHIEQNQYAKVLGGTNP